MFILLAFIDLRRLAQKSLGAACGSGKVLDVQPEHTQHRDTMSTDTMSTDTHAINNARARLEGITIAFEVADALDRDTQPDAIREVFDTLDKAGWVCDDTTEWAELRGSAWTAPLGTPCPELPEGWEAQEYNPGQAADASDADSEDSPATCRIVAPIDYREAAEGCADSSGIYDRLREMALEVQVRGGWYTPGDDKPEPEEYSILLTTGGPALRIVGDLDQGQPASARMEWQDCGTLWKFYQTDDTLLRFAELFQFGE